MANRLNVANIGYDDNNDALTIASDGTISAGTLGSGVVFPAGHVIQTITDQYASTSSVVVTTTSNDYFGSNLECAITPKANGNKLFIQAFINGLYNNANATYSLHSGFAYDADFSSGNGTTIGPREVIADYQNYLNTSVFLLGNLYYSIVVTVGTQAPSAGSESIIRPIFKSYGGDFQITSNGGSNLGVSSMIVMEIQS